MKNGLSARAEAGVFRWSFVRFGIAILILSMMSVQASAQSNVVTYHNDNSRSGLNAVETLLTPANVNSTQFGKLFSVTVVGYVYAQPLYLANVPIPNKGTHNVVFVATEHDNVYAFDADNGSLLWQVSFLNPSVGINTVSQSDISCDELGPEAGITGTPVIDPLSGTAGTIYLVARTNENGSFVQRLHALDVTTGAERPGSPVVITASVTGNGDGSSGNNITFNSLTENNRSGLLLEGTHVVISWASPCDISPYHGWVLSYNENTLVQEAVLNTTPKGGLGGIWMGAAGPAADSSNIYLSTGNGTYDGTADFGDSVLKLGQPANNSFALSDWFTPYDQSTLSNSDLDLGSGGVLLLPDQASGSPYQHLLLTAGKDGTIYLLNRDNMGHFHSGSDSQIVQSLPGALVGIWSMPAWWNNTAYFGGTGDVGQAGDNLKAFSFNATTGMLSSPPSSHSSTVFKFTGTTPSISANNTSNAIVWALQTDQYSSGGAAILHAYDATNLAKELYNTQQNSSRDNPGPAVKFTVPTVVNGKVYVGTENSLSVYGLFVPTAATPTFSLPGGTYNSAQPVSISDTTPSATIFYTTDGSMPTASSTKYNGPISVTQTTTINAIAVATGFTNSAVATSIYVLQVAIPTFNPTGGTISPAQLVTIADTTPGSVIYYTTNGTVPTAIPSLQYSSPFTLASSAVVRAIAVATGYNNNTVASTSYTVSGTSPVLASIAVTPANPSLAVAGTQQFTATGTYSDNSTQNLTSSVTWSSSNTATATITTAGVATAVAAGTTTIQATSGSVSGSTTLTVTSLPSGLVGHWTFDDGSGTTAVDSSGGGHTATLVNGMTWTTGKIGTAITANGTNQYGNIPAFSLTSTSAVTVTMWVNRTYSTVGGHTLFENSTNYNNFTTGFGLFPDDADCGGIQASVHGNVGYSVNCYAQPSSGVWHHLAIVYDKTQTGTKETALYIDGVLQTPTKNLNTSDNTNAFGSNPIYLFARGGTQEYTAGSMDELQIYSRALTAAEIQQVYNQGSSALVSIAVTPANPSMAKGATQAFTATGTYSDNSTQNLTSSVTWTSSNTATATITTAGVATGVATGTTTIQTASGSITGSTTLTVTPPVLVSLAVTPANSSVAKGATQSFTATGTYSDNSTQNLTGSVTWSSSNTAAATITTAGVATAVAAGTTTIQAVTGSITGSTNLTVTPAPLVSIAVTPVNPSAAKGTTQAFSATGTYSDNSTQNITSSVTWSSTSTAIATINSAGVATGVATGTTTIRATSGSIVGSTTLTVIPAVLVSLAVTPANSSIMSGATQPFTATGTYSDSSMQNLTSSVTWSSSNTAAATITTAGVATAVAAGTTTIQAVTGSITGSTNLTVASVPVLASIAVTPANPSLAVAGTQQFTATGTYSDNSTQNLTSSVTWSSSNTATATITTAGVATAVAAGTTTIQATSGSVSGSTTLTVTSLPSGLVGHWTFDDGSGTTAADSSGNNDATTFPNGISWVTGKIAGAISANGTTQYGSIPAINLSTTNAVTVAMWVNRTYNLTMGGPLIEATTNFNNSTTGFGLFPDDSSCNGIMAAVQGNLGYSMNCYKQPSSGVWHHLAIVYDKTQTGTKETALYIDGVLQTPTQNEYTATNTNSFGNNPLYLFARGGTLEFKSGEMDDLQIYSRALTAAEIQQVYNQGSSALVSIAVTPANPSMAKGATQAFTATGTYSDNSTQNLTSSVTWTSSNTATATITTAGVATGVATGTTTIQTASGSITGSTTLTVTPPVLVSLAVTPANSSVAKGATQSFTATGTYSDNSTQNLTGSVTWSSSNTAAATITTAGVATAVAAGTTTIQAVTGSITGSTNFTVTSVPVLVSIAVTPANPSIAVAATQQFTATGTFSNSSTQNLTSSVTWSSSNTATATITTAGVATAIAAGTTTIQAASGSISGSTTLTVTSLPSGLVGHWTFDDGSGTTAADSSGNNDATTFPNGISWVTGKIAGAISANGTTQYGSIPAINLSTTNAVTVAMWVNRTYNLTMGGPLIEATTNFNNSTTGFGLFPDDSSCNGIMAAVQGNLGYSMNCYKQPSSGAWHHFVAVFDKSQTGTKETALYIDGVLQTPTLNEYTANNTNNFGNNPLYLFARGGTLEFKSGEMDDLQIYNRALTAAEIQSLP